MRGGWSEGPVVEEKLICLHPFLLLKPLLLKSSLPALVQSEPVIDVPSSSLFLPSSPSLSSQPPSSPHLFLSGPQCPAQRIFSELKWGALRPGRAGLLLTGCRFMARRPTLGPTEGFWWDYRLLSAGQPFLILSGS